MHNNRINTTTIFYFLLALSGLLNAACSSTGISKTTNAMTAGSSIIESKRSFKIKEDKTFQKGPYQMQETKSSIVIMWETPTETISMVEYGPTDTLGQKQTLLEPVTIHEVEITGLTAETVYFYRVGDGTTWSRSFTFRTAVEPTTPFRFAAYSDSQENLRDVVSFVSFCLTAPPNSRTLRPCHAKPVWTFPAHCITSWCAESINRKYSKMTTTRPAFSNDLAKQ